MPKYSRLDLLLGGTTNPGTTKLIRTEESDNGYSVWATLVGGSKGYGFVPKGFQGTIEEYLKEEVETPLFDLTPVGKNVSCLTPEGNYLIGFCEGATPFNYIVVLPDGSKRYVDAASVVTPHYTYN